MVTMVTRSLLVKRKGPSLAQVIPALSSLTAKDVSSASSLVVLARQDPPTRMSRTRHPSTGSCSVSRPTFPTLTSTRPWMRHHDIDLERHWGRWQGGKRCYLWVGCRCRRVRGLVDCCLGSSLIFILIIDIK